MEHETRASLMQELIDTERRVRDYMLFAERAADERLGRVLHTQAEIEGRYAEHLRGHLNKLK